MFPVLAQPLKDKITGVLDDERRAQGIFHQRVEADRELDRKAVKHDLVARRKPAKT
jgi:hypothetical protein